MSTLTLEARYYQHPLISNPADARKRDVADRWCGAVLSQEQTADGVSLADSPITLYDKRMCLESDPLIADSY